MKYVRNLVATALFAYGTFGMPSTTQASRPCMYAFEECIHYFSCQAIIWGCQGNYCLVSCPCNGSGTPETCEL
jgi:hypothetical protein